MVIFTLVVEGSMTWCDEIAVKYISNIFEIYFSVKIPYILPASCGALQGDFRYLAQNLFYLAQRTQRTQRHFL